MALWRSPMYYGENWWDWPMVPSRIFDQNFGMGMLDDALREMRRMERTMNQLGAPYWMRPSLREGDVGTGMSEVINEKDKFAINLDVKQFKPEELAVTTGDNYVTIEGKHEEKSDEHGFISRHFKRRYMLPKGVESTKVTSRLSADGILSIEAPKLAIEAPPAERPVQIEAEKKPAIAEGKKK